MAVERDFDDSAAQRPSRLKRLLRGAFLGLGWGVGGIAIFVAVSSGSKRPWEPIDTWMIVVGLWAWVGYQGIKDLIEWNGRRLDRIERQLREIQRRLDGY